MAKDKTDKKKSKSKDAEESVKKNKKMKLGSMAVKWRPNTINDLVGQEAITTQVRGMFKHGSMPQSILIHGDSGCGKTTTARIIARTLFCDNLDKEFNPCGDCSHCKYGDIHPDLHEMNMAETRGIDDVRAMIASSNNMPTMGKYRIFIIDEVHAWTTQAETAFLKPLEEPPERTIWILCTTDPQKLKTTIIGRCRKLPIRKLDPEAMSKRLTYISKKEGVDLKEREDGAKILRLMTDLSNGQMRDGIDLLEGLIYAIRSGDKMDTKSLLQAIMTSGDGDLEKASAYLVASILNADLKDVVAQIRGSANARGLLNKCRWLIQYLLDNAVGLAKYSPYNAKIFAKIAKDNSIKVKLHTLVKMQYLLIEIESKFNSMSVDETVVMLSMVGNFIATEMKDSVEKKEKSK